MSDLNEEKPEVKVYCEARSENEGKKFVVELTSEVPIDRRNIIESLMFVANDVATYKEVERPALSVAPPSEFPE